QPGEQEYFSNIDVIEGDEIMNIDDDQLLNIEANEKDNGDEDFIDYMINNSLITDNWNLDISSNDDAELIDKKEIYILMKKCRSFISMINKSSILKGYFDQLRATLDKKRSLADDCETRWNSTFYLIDSFIDLKILIVKFFRDKNLMDVRRALINKMISIELQHDDWVLLANIHMVLKPFD
ncbi:unnamed protein product, partial [Didymodactylos carnosus]